MKKTFIAVFVLACSAFAQSGAIKEAGKPELAAPKVEKAVTPLTAEEKLAIRDLQVQIQGMQRQIDVELPKQISDAQDRVNKLVAGFQAKHNATEMMLKYDLTWAPPQGGAK